MKGLLKTAHLLMHITRRAACTSYKVNFSTPEPVPSSSRAHSTPLSLCHHPSSLSTSSYSIRVIRTLSVIYYPASGSLPSYSSCKLASLSRANAEHLLLLFRRPRWYAYTAEGKGGVLELILLQTTVLDSLRELLPEEAGQQAIRSAWVCLPRHELNTVARDERAAGTSHSFLIQQCCASCMLGRVDCTEALDTSHQRAISLSLALHGKQGTTLAH